MGDSRIYLLRGETMQQLSIDHTWIQEALDKGIITPDQVHGHPNAHIIRRYLGSAAPTRADLRLRLRREENDEQSLANQGVELYPGDMVLMCSDGLTDMVSDDDIHTTLLPALARKNSTPAAMTPLETGVKSLVDQACQHGGNDNITIIALRFQLQPALQSAVTRSAAVKTSEVRPAAWRRPVAMGLIGLFSLLVIAIALWLGMNWLQSRPGTLNPGIAPRTQMSTPLPNTLMPAAAPTSTAFQPATLAPPTRLPTAGPTLTPWPTHTRPAAPSATPPHQ